jgi:hypothetical protein
MPYKIETLPIELTDKLRERLIRDGIPPESAESIFGIIKIAGEPMNYALDENHNPIPCSFWDYAFPKIPREVAQEIIGRFRVSTCFIGLGRVLFETMIFDREGHESYQEHCATWDEAQDMHERAVEWAIQRMNHAYPV